MKFNTLVNSFQSDLTNLINNCNLPISVIRLVLESALAQVRDIEKTAIGEEAKEAVAEEEKAE